MLDKPFHCARQHHALYITSDRGQFFRRHRMIDALHIPDTQSAHDDRRVAIQRVGVRRVRYPVQLRIEGAVLPIVAEWSLDVALPAEQKGTHMSRFVAWLDAIDEPLD